jgi:hypothetical protein
MSAPVRFQLRRTKGWRMPPNSVAVTRPGRWGNYAGATREDFDRDLATMSNADRAFYCDQVQEHLRGRNLGCWCDLPAPGEADKCHGASLLVLANE